MNHGEGPLPIILAPMSSLRYGRMVLAARYPGSARVEAAHDMATVPVRMHAADGHAMLRVLGCACKAAAVLQGRRSRSAAEAPEVGVDHASPRAWPKFGSKRQHCS